MPIMDESSPIGAAIARDNRRADRLSQASFPQPDSTRIFTIANQKGGVGKTTTAVNIAAALANQNLNVLLIDIDPQGNASTALGIDHYSELTSIYDVIIDDVPMREAVAQCPDFETLTDAWDAGSPIAWDPKDSAPVADAAVFLLSDLARMVTGEILHVDGGYHAMAAPLR